MMLNYPLKFEPILKERLWGGDKLHSVLKKNFSKKRIGESWEISDVENSISVVSNGKLKGQQLTSFICEELVGKHVFKRFGRKFPLLIKYIDAQQNLSVQVHPNDELALKRYNSNGKTEMWYILDAEPDSKLVLGFTEKVNKETYKKLLASNKLVSILNEQIVNNNEVYFIEAGIVHSIGKGILLAEIQQTSDKTYRIYDWDRLDSNGNKRQLHTQEAIDAIKFEVGKNYKKQYSNKLNEVSSIIESQYFNTNVIVIKNNLSLNYSNLDSFVIYMCVEGEGSIDIFKNKESIKYGETILIPAIANRITIKTETSCKLLEISIS